MALIGINVNETTKYIPEKERGVENPTTFHIGVLTNRDRLELGGMFEEVKDNKLKAAMFGWELIKKCVKKIENVIDPVSKEMRSYDKIDDAVLMMFSNDEEVLIEVAGKIQEFNNLSTTEAKN